MFFHVILTGECNSQCRYCFEEAMEDTESEFEEFDIDYSLPRQISYNIDELERFCKMDPECVLTFYGGEPLLRIDDLKRIVDRVKAKNFMIQTNGLLLDQLDPEYVNCFHTILVSIDGDETCTDYYRGKGTYRKVIDNLKLIRRNGFSGELIARMTVMEQTDIYKSVTWLLDNADFPFSSIHWQLNAGFWKDDFARRNFEEWTRESYNPGIRRLVELWVDRMASSSRVLRLYPLLGIAHSLLKGESASLLRCGGGWINYAIQTDGHLIICPTMWGIRDYYIGHISNANPLNLRKIFAGEPCTRCDISGICGGRCLYQNLTHRWSADAYKLVCGTVRNLIDAVAEQLPRIKELVESKSVMLQHFEFIKYNGCEIIP